MPYAKSLKNVTLLKKKDNGELKFVLLHQDGTIDLYFKYVIEQLMINRRLAHNTLISYSSHIARFIDYMIETANCSANDKPSFEDIRNYINAYPKALACSWNTENDAVARVCRALNLSPLSIKSQEVHLAAVNYYLSLSESFNIRMAEMKDSDFNKEQLFSGHHLFSMVNVKRSLSSYERRALISKSVLAGVISGGPKFLKCVILKPYLSYHAYADKRHYSFEESAFPIMRAPDLIKYGFLTLEHKLLFCFLMASGSRLSEALLLTINDINVNREEIYIINPRTRNIKEYNCFFTAEELSRLPWKGRTTANTFLLEPFASEFWRLLQTYLNTKKIATNRHPFLFQISRGQRRGYPLLLTHTKNLRATMHSACKRINIREKGIHSLRHMYGVYCKNYLPLPNGTFGLPLETVQNIMGHANIQSTQLYAVPDLIRLRLAYKINTDILQGFEIKSIRETIVATIKQRLLEIENTFSIPGISSW
jgi:integrase